MGKGGSAKTKIISNITFCNGEIFFSTVNFNQERIYCMRKGAEVTFKKKDGTSSHVMLRYVTSRYVTARQVTSCHATSRHMMSGQVRSCQVTSRQTPHATRYTSHLTSRHVSLGHVTSCVVT